MQENEGVVFRVCSLSVDLSFFNAVKTLPQIPQTGPVEKELTFINFYAEEKELDFQVNLYTDPVKRQNLFTNKT